MIWSNEFMKRLWEIKSQSPQRWQSLPPELETRARAVWERVRPWWSPTYERFEAQLTKDEHPDVEIAAWERISDAMKIYMKSHPTADRSWVQDLLCMVSLGGELPKEWAAKRKMFKELRRLYIRCGGNIRPLTLCETPSQMPHRKGKSTPDAQLHSEEGAPLSPQTMPALPIEKVQPVDVMTSDIIIVRDRLTRKCCLLYPNPLPPMSDMMREQDREIVTLMIEFEDNNERHKDLIGNILKIAKGDSE